MFLHNFENNSMFYFSQHRFISQLLRLLVASNEKFGPQIQKHVKTLVGEEMAPDLYPLLFDQIRGIVDKFFDQQGQVRPVSVSGLMIFLINLVQLLESI